MRKSTVALAVAGAAARWVGQEESRAEPLVTWVSARERFGRGALALGLRVWAGLRGGRQTPHGSTGQGVLSFKVVSL